MSDIYDILDSDKRSGQKYSKEEYKAYKQQEKAEIYEKINAQTEAIIDDPAELAGYLELQARLDRYSVSNALLILSQYPQARNLKEYNVWIERGANINKGEKAISILEPYNYQREDGSKGTGYNVKKVFDISQTTEYASPLRTSAQDAKKVLRALVEDAPVAVIASDEPGPGGEDAWLNPDKETISVRRGLDENCFFRSLAGAVAKLRLSIGRENMPAGQGQTAKDCIVYMLAKNFGFAGDGQMECPKLPEGMEAKTIREELSRARLVYSQMKSGICLSMEREQKARQREKMR